MNILEIIQKNFYINLEEQNMILLPIYNFVIALISGVINGTSDAVSTIGSLIGSGTSAAISAIGSGTSAAVSAIGSGVSSLMNSLLNLR